MDRVRWFLIMAIVLFCQPLVADDDHDEIKRLRDQETVVSLESLIRDALQRVGGRVIKVELEEVDERYSYEIEILDETNQVRELWYDAHTGQFLKEEADE